MALLQTFDWPTTVGEFLAQFGDLLWAAVAFVVAFVVVYSAGRYLLVKFVRTSLTARDFDTAVVQLAANTAAALAFFVAIAVAFTVAGFGSFLGAFATLGGALALALGFAAQDVVANFVAGVFILKDKPFEVGDWIQWNDKSGVVRHIDLRVSKLETFNNEVITVPNSELANNAVTNPMANDELRLQFVFGVGYDDDIDEATEIILEDARGNPDVLDDPEPSVRTTELADSYVGLESRIWVGNPDRATFKRVLSDHIQGVKERFDARGIDMPYPYRQLAGGISIEEISGLDQVELAGD